MSKIINGFTLAALTAVQASIINQARAAAPDSKGQGADERKQIKREVYSVVKAKFGIAENIKVRAITRNPDHAEYLVLHVGGKRNRDAGKAFRLGADGKWDGTYVTSLDLFPPVQTPAPGTDGNQGSVFGGTQSGGWFRLDPTQVAMVLTHDYADHDVDSASDLVEVGNSEGGGVLPTPHLMLAGRNDLAIAADGAIYRKA